VQSKWLSGHNGIQKISTAFNERWLTAPDWH
jgi:hypothetical protein